MNEYLGNKIILKRELMIYNKVMNEYKVYWKRNRYNYLKELWGI